MKQSDLAIELDGDDSLEVEVIEASKDKTNFPKAGDNQKVSMRNSQWQTFPVEWAQDIKDNWPEIWKLGGNIRGNSQYAKLTPVVKNNGVPSNKTEENAVRLREAWAARHIKNNRLAGVIALMKWLVVGDIGLSKMKEIINERKKYIKDKKNK